MCGPLGLVGGGQEGLVDPQDLKAQVKAEYEQHQKQQQFSSSEEEKGSFESSAEEISVHVKSEESRPVRSPQFPAGLKILLVEGSETRSKLWEELEEILSSFSYQVEHCSTLQKLFTLKGPLQFDTILVEGEHLVKCTKKKHIEKLCKAMPVVCVATSSLNRKQRVSAITRGAVDFLSHPWSYHMIKSIWQHAVRKMMKQRKLTPGPRDGKQGLLLMERKLRYCEGMSWTQGFIAREEAGDGGSQSAPAPRKAKKSRHKLKAKTRALWKETDVGIAEEVTHREIEASKRILVEQSLLGGANPPPHDFPWPQIEPCDDDTCLLGIEPEVFDFELGILGV